VADERSRRESTDAAKDGCVQVGADVGDHHVHVRAGEAADELREGERKEDLA
jgi:hypothetical protein